MIPDIHGCSQTFRALIEKIDLRAQDQLFLLGDYVNKGPDSAGVLDYIFQLQKKKLHIFPLVGNHEIMLLEANRSKYILKSFVQKYLAYNVVDRHTERVKEQYVRFIELLPYYFILEDYILVHAGFNFAAFDPLQDFEAMLYIRNFHPDLNFLQGRQIVHGHDPKPLSLIQKHIAARLPTLPLDNGCVYHGQKEQLGHLLCLDLLTQELILQENLDTVLKV
ncbi:MAG: serine/threonine protein phosphatase [Microscillaceae bacterium]|nr:serine/threonine protein phosphatase [Microscillaceae bacterium]